MNTVQNIPDDAFPWKYSDFKGLIRNTLCNCDQLGSVSVHNRMGIEDG